MKCWILTSVVLAAVAIGCQKDAPPAPAAGPMPGAAPVVPAAVPTGAPTATPTGVCAQFQNCCNAVAALPNMSSIAPTCAQAPTFAALGAQGEPSCIGGLRTLRLLGSAQPTGLPAACR